MSTKDKQVLGKALWGIIDKFPAKMTADTMRDYMISLFCFCYLSDNYEQTAKRELGKDYPNEEALSTGETALQRWYIENSKDIGEFEAHMRRKIHYIIKPEYLWTHIVELARTQHSGLLDILDEGFRCIETGSSSDTFRGLFSEVRLSSEKLGKTHQQRNETLCNIVLGIADVMRDASLDVEELGDACEYLIARFSSYSRFLSGEFYTPQAVSTILSRIVVLDAQNPERGVKERIKKVLDFACGSGSLLLNVRRQMGNQIGSIYGQEINLATSNLARMNMLLHGVKASEFQLSRGDFLALPSVVDPSEKVEFDAIVATPPFSLQWNPKEETAQDFRFQNYGVAPKSAADFAFLLHGFHYLSQDGTMAIVLQADALSREGAERAIRQRLLEDRNIDTIIALPSKLFYSTGSPTCIIVLKKCRTNDDVLFVDASRDFAKDNKRNRLRIGEDGEPNDIDRIIDTYRYRREIINFSRCVPLSEIKENNYNLAIPHYVENLGCASYSQHINKVPSIVAEAERKLGADWKRENVSNEVEQQNRGLKL